MKITPKEERQIIRRDYTMVALLIRKVFDIPKNEMVLDLVWNKDLGVLRLTTLKDD